MKNFYLLFSIIFLINMSFAQTLYYGDYSFKLKDEYTKESSQFVQKSFYNQNETNSNWTNRAVIQIFKDKNNPIKQANELSEKIEKSENKLLLKLVVNKKQNISILTYLENIEQDNGVYFIYHVSKFLKNKEKQVVEIDYNKKFSFINTDSVLDMTKEIKSKNDDYIEKMIITDLPIDNQ